LENIVGEELTNDKNKHNTGENKEFEEIIEQNIISEILCNIDEAQK
jgi:hypothetical protein